MQISDEMVEAALFAHEAYLQAWVDSNEARFSPIEKRKALRDALESALSLPVQPVAWPEIEWSYREDDNRYPRDFWHARVVHKGFKTEWVSVGEQEQKVLPDDLKAETERELLDEWREAFLTTPPVPPTKGQEELAEIERMLNEGQGDDDGMQIMPDFDEGMSTLAKVETCLHLLEKRRDVIAAYAADENWRDDPSADERWNAGLDFGMSKLCAYLGVDPAAVTWDAATETLDGDVCAVIGNILRAKYGDDWGPLSRIATKGPEDDMIAALDEEAVIAGWNACRRSIYAVCEDVQSEAERLRTSSKPGTASEEQHAKGYYAGSCYAAKSIARGFSAMDAMDDDNVQSALRSRPASALPVVKPSEPYDTWSEQELATEIERLKAVRNTTSRIIEDMILKRAALIPSVQP